MATFQWLLSGGDFMPHAYCYLRNPSMIRLHFWSDLLIGLAYVAISLTLVYMVRRARRDIPFHWIFLAFGTFIIACGLTHFMEVWTLWVPVYWLAGGIKGVTAVASVATALILPPLVPRTLSMVRTAKLADRRKAELEQANARLELEIADRRRAEENLRKLAETLEIRVRQRTAELSRANDELAEKAAIVEHSHDAILSAELDGTITSWNPAAERLYGYTASEVVGQSVGVLSADGIEHIQRNVALLRSGKSLKAFEAQQKRKDGQQLTVLLSISPIRDVQGAVRGASIIAHDISERKRREEQLREVQKLESLGLIAGGVAHDFNNLLVGIMGNATLVLEATPPDSEDHIFLEQVVKSAERAAELTGQLLAYAGKGRFVSRKIDLSKLVSDITPLLKTSISKNVQVRLELRDDLPPVEGDPSQLHQVIMNLVINGAEAIGEQNGTVVVNTGVGAVDPGDVRQSFSDDPEHSGPYVVLSVRDSGAGMSEAVRARIFDPFFTTKFTGRGLGLSAVMGIVRSHKGYIRVDSEPGRGSNFTIFLPAVLGTAERADPEAASNELRGSGVVLVVDDEDVVRKTAAATLRRYGYEVQTAADGADAVRQLMNTGTRIDLVLLDMTMPFLSGEETLRQLRAVRPDIPVVVSSGYDEIEAVRRFTAEGVAAFIQKPYAAAALAKVVKQTLGEHRAQKEDAPD